MFEVSFHYSWLPGQPISKSGEAQLFAMLEGIHQHGSLRAAVNRAGLSYRYAWGLIGKWEALFGQKLVVMERGRGTRLTPLGEKLLWAQQRVAARLAPQLQSLSAELERELAGVLDADAMRITMSASHDLALAALRDFLLKQKGPRLDLRFQGSADSLKAFAAKQTEMAGFHVSPLLAADLALFRLWLKPRKSVLIRFAARSQGLMVAAGNPRHINTLADLAHTHARFVNRQPGSGTRMAFDQLLAQAEIKSRHINGYDQEEYTHLAVAATVASGHAEAGLGIEAAARHFNLDFVPLFSEDYYFACRREFLDNPKGVALRESMRKTALKNALRKLPGYDLADIADVREIDSVLGA